MYAFKYVQNVKFCTKLVVQLMPTEQHRHLPHTERIVQFKTKLRFHICMIAKHTYIHAYI